MSNSNLGPGSTKTTRQRDYFLGPQDFSDEEECLQSKMDLILNFDHPVLVRQDAKYDSDLIKAVSGPVTKKSRSN